MMMVSQFSDVDRYKTIGIEKVACKVKASLYGGTVIKLNVLGTPHRSAISCQTANNAEMFDLQQHSWETLAYINGESFLSLHRLRWTAKTAYRVRK